MSILLLNDDQPRGLGYLEIDQRATGLPVSVGHGMRFEADTYTCTHCHTVVILNPARTRERYKCKGCNHHICDPCAAKRAQGDPCRTMAQIMDEIQTRAARQAGGEPSSVLP